MQPWQAVIFSEVIFPTVMAFIFVIAYMFVKLFLTTPGKANAPLLISTVVVSLGPIIWNAAVLLVQFPFSVLLGPMMDLCCIKFGSIVVFIVHLLALVRMVGFFEFLISI